MLTPSKKLQLSGGHIVVDSSNTAVYTSGNHFGSSLPWDENVDDINTPDIDVDFFMNESPFRKPLINNTPMKEEYNPFTEPLPSLVDTVAVVPEVDTRSRGSLSDTENSFADLSQLINESASNTSIMVAPNDVLHINTSVAADCSPTLDISTPAIISSFATLTPLSNVTSMQSVDMSGQQLIMQNVAPLQPQIDIQSQFATHFEPNPRPQSANSSYAMPLSPAESYISQNSYISPSPQSDVTMDSKDDLFHPTVIDDHLYTLPSTSTSTDNEFKYSSLRRKNNAASKRSRLTKRDKQKQMEEKIAYFVEDNAKAKREIEQLEKQIEWCKEYLFKKVLQASKS